MNTLIPASYIFSYWIFAWAVAYILVKYAYRLSKSKIPKQIEWFNPSLIFLIALICNMIELILLVMNRSNVYKLFKYALMIVCMKVIPLWLIWSGNINVYRDISIGLGIFAVYTVYLWVNGTDLFAVYADVIKSVNNDEDRTPFEYWLNRVIVHS